MDGFPGLLKDRICMKWEMRIPARLHLPALQARCHYPLASLSLSGTTWVPHETATSLSPGLHNPGPGASAPWNPLREGFQLWPVFGSALPLSNSRPSVSMQENVCLSYSPTIFCSFKKQCRSYLRLINPGNNGGTCTKHNIWLNTFISQAQRPHQLPHLTSM